MAVQSFKEMATRHVQGEERFKDVVMELGGLSEEDAIKVRRLYVKMKLVKFSYTSSEFNIKYGDLFNVDALHRAVEMANDKGL